MADVATRISVPTHAGSVANAKGGYTQLIASTGAEVWGLLLELGNGSGAAVHAVDIATGGAGSETVLIPDIVVRTIGSNEYEMVFVPIHIAAGTRIAARGQNSVGNRAINVTCRTLDEHEAVALAYTRATAYGVTLSGATAGTAIDTGAVLNTDATPVEISASTAQDIKWMVISVLTDAAGGAGTLTFDVCTGAASSEVVVPTAENLQVSSHGASNTTLSPRLISVPCDIPAGTRVSIRAQANATTDSAFPRDSRISIVGLDSSTGGAGGGGGGMLVHPGMSGGLRG